MSAAKKLTPPDFNRCQAMKPNGHTFMTIGGRPALERCESKPWAIATEMRPGPDGQVGSMSVCSDCAGVMMKQMPDYAWLNVLTDLDIFIGKNTESTPAGMVRCSPGALREMVAEVVKQAIKENLRGED